MVTRINQTGFTLLEMLVAITLFLMLVSLGYGALRTGTRSMEAVDKGIADINHLRIGWNFIHDALSRAEPIATKIPGNKGLHFDGEEETVQFVADMPAYLGFGGLYMIRIAVAENNGSRQLLLYRIPHSLFEDWNDETHLQKAVLADNVKSLKISYYGKPSGSSENDWHLHWQEEKTLPLLVRIELSQDKGDDWPLLIARLQRSTASGNP